MNTGLAVGAAIGCALCNAAAAILQKVSSDKVSAIRTYDTKILIRLLRQLPYASGLLLDLLAGILTLIAVNRLPLFAAQAIIASCVVVTAFLERVFLKHELRRSTYYAAGVVLAGLACVALAAHGERTATVSLALRCVLIAMPLVIAALGLGVLKFDHKLGAFLLAVLSGCAFGGVSIIGRVLTYPNPIWLTAKNPLLWSLIAYGALGMFFFTAALQRTLATVVNSVMTSAQTVVPLVVGILLLGDTARNGLWLPLWFGCLLVVAGCTYIAYTD
ncbi:MAG TPA: hypothetical protein VMB52_01450 [Verrucomicrobiae bacterium]|nr:hypothetical protein [Verrucomicrobiae bacterium]